MPRTTHAPEDAHVTVDTRPLFDEPVMPAQPKPACAFVIHAVLDDFPFDLTFTGSAETLRLTVQRLRAIGAVPPTPQARANVADEAARSAPTCPYHGTMSESTKVPGTWFCKAKMGDGTYCKERSPK